MIGVLISFFSVPVSLESAGIPGDKVIHEISREERLAFGMTVKNFPFTITEPGEFKEAVITQGGVSVRDINPGSMESKKIKNLYFTGEVLDLDAVTGAIIFRLHGPPHILLLWI